MCELKPSVQARDLPPEIVEFRERVAEEHQRMDEFLQPRIDAHIAAVAREVDAVIETHRRIGDRTDLEIRADTRWSAIWELSGRCLAICRVVLHDPGGGFTSEAVGSLRALWEATVLLGAVAFHGEDAGLRRWLAGDLIRERVAREVVGRKELLARERMEEAGVEFEGRGTAELGGEIYDLLSQPAHHRRGGFPETISVDLRELTYGPHPNAEVRAHHVSYASQLIETALLVVIDSLGDIIGRDYVRDALSPMQTRLEEIRAAFPLPE
jgi:hypothetical protein